MKNLTQIILKEEEALAKKFEENIQNNQKSENFHKEELEAYNKIDTTNKDPSLKDQ